ncbi:MAG: methionine--tRNA ligase subunit beta [Panacagrimonas sp.]
MPGSSAEILRRVGDSTAPAALRLDRDTRWRADGERVITKGAALWPRSDVAADVAVRHDSGQARPAIKEIRVEQNAPVDAAPSVVEEARLGIDEFMKVELRVAKVLEAEAVPKSKKLLKLKVDTGADQRTIVAGIAEAYQPEQLIGRTIVIVANLKPAKLMGIESNGMVLAASPDGGKPMLVGFDQGVPPGVRVR